MILNYQAEMEMLRQASSQESYKGEPLEERWSNCSGTPEVIKNIFPNNFVHLLNKHLLCARP